MTTTHALPRFLILLHSWRGVGLFDTTLGQWVEEAFSWRRDTLDDSVMFRRLQQRGYPVGAFRQQLRAHGRAA